MYRSCIIIHQKKSSCITNNQPSVPYSFNPYPNFSIRAGSSLPTQVEGPATTEKMPTQHAAPATPRPANNTTPGTSYNNP